MDAPTLPSLSLLLGLAALLGAVFGYATRTGDFCARRAIALRLKGQRNNSLRQWGLALGIALAATAVLQMLALADTGNALYATPRLPWLSLAVGGLAFGCGMQLAGGCPSRQLARLGGGRLDALVILLVVALASSLSLHGVLAPLRLFFDARALVLPAPQTLPELAAHVWPALPAGFSPALRLTLGALLVLALWRTTPAHLRLPALLLGVPIAGAWYVSSHLGYVPEHPETLQPAYLATASGRPEAISFVGPLGHGLDLLLLWTDRSRHLAFGGAIVLGCLGGALLHALLHHQWRTAGFSSAATLTRGLSGGLLMGWGGVTALGCSIGHGLSGLSLLSLGSLLALAGITAGVWLGLRLAPGE